MVAIKTFIVLFKNLARWNFKGPDKCHFLEHQKRIFTSSPEILFAIKKLKNKICS